MNFNTIDISFSLLKIVAARDFAMPQVARCVFPLDSMARDPSFSPLLSDMPVFSLLSTAQTGLKKFLEYVQLGTSDKVARLLDKGLDPNYHDSDSGGREGDWGLCGGEGTPSTRPGACM